jgi:hypothetical protein
MLNHHLYKKRMQEKNARKECKKRMQEKNARKECKEKMKVYMSNNTYISNK